MLCIQDWQKCGRTERCTHKQSQSPFYILEVYIAIVEQMVLFYIYLYIRVRLAVFSDVMLGIVCHTHSIFPIVATQSISNSDLLKHPITSSDDVS